MSHETVASIADSDIAWAAADPPAAARIKMQLTAEASLRYGAVLDDTQMYQAFRFSCGNQIHFVGVIYETRGSQAFQSPVLYVSRDAENIVVLRLGAWAGVWLSSWMVWGDEPGIKERIDRPEFRGVLCQRGALSELSADDSLWD